ncbi:uncharacterized protein LOC142332569 [Lycorma delicatula]|uniref:uncharacterized protein LOC142332569 n=1 Tax=Lycorma delicatula TaxID=130591 RepID=UPI003F518A0B
MKSIYFTVVICLCVMSHVLSQSNEPIFPENSGWDNQIQKSLDFLRNPDIFPGNPDWVINFKRETTLPTNCRETRDIFGSVFPLYPQSTIIYGPGYVTSLSNLPATKTTYICNDPLFYNTPFLMLETRTTVNTGYYTSHYSAYALYNLKGILFKTEWDTNLSDVPVTRTTYFCKDSLFYEEPFLMLETQLFLNTDYEYKTYTAYTLYNMNGNQFKTGNLVTVVRKGKTTSK